MENVNLKSKFEYLGRHSNYTVVTIFSEFESLVRHWYIGDQYL